MNKAEILEQFPIFQMGACCFSHLSEEELMELQNHKKQVHFKKGDLILTQEETNEDILFLLEGFVREYIMDNGREISLRITQSGDFINLSSALDNSAMQFTAEAISDVTICKLEKEYLTELLERNSSMTLQLLRHHGILENDLFALVRNNFFKQTNGKVATVLLYLTQFKVSEQHSICSLLTRREIASFAGISMENLVRSLKSLASEQIIQLDGADILIKNKEKLKLISKNG